MMSLPKEKEMFSASGLRVWRDGGWTILHAETGGSQTTVSLSPEQASALLTWLTLEPNDREPSEEDLAAARARALRALHKARDRAEAAEHLDDALYPEKKRAEFDPLLDAEWCVSLTVKDWLTIEAALDETRP